MTTTLEMTPIVGGTEPAEYMFSGEVSSADIRKDKAECTCWKGDCTLPAHEELYQ